MKKSPHRISACKKQVEKLRFQVKTPCERRIYAYMGTIAVEGPNPCERNMYICISVIWQRGLFTYVTKGYHRDLPPVKVQTDQL